MENTLYLTLALAWIIGIYFYGMQRYVQLILREIDIDFSVGRKIMLPSWFALNLLITLLKYGLLVYLLYYYSWQTTLLIVSPIFVISLFIPIPYKKLYKSIIKNSLQSNLQIYPEHIPTIMRIQIESNLLDK